MLYFFFKGSSLLYFFIVVGGFIIVAIIVARLLYKKGLTPKKGLTRPTIVAIIVALPLYFFILYFFTRFLIRHTIIEVLTIVGTGFTISAFLIALLIYRLQKNDIAKTLSELAFAIREVDLEGARKLLYDWVGEKDGEIKVWFDERDIRVIKVDSEEVCIDRVGKKIKIRVGKEEVNDVRRLLFDWVSEKDEERRKVSHVLVVSRFSAFPGFWISEEKTCDLLKLLARVPEKRLIGPDDELFKSYAEKVAQYISDENNISKLPPEFRKRAGDWARTGKRSSGQIIDIDIIKKTIEETIKNEYSEYSRMDDWIVKSLRKAPKAIIENLSVNAVIVKLKKPNIFNSYFEVFFFGSPPTRHTTDIPENIPDVFRPFVLYHSGIELMAFLWRYELETLLRRKTDRQWLEEFFKIP